MAGNATVLLTGIANTDHALLVPMVNLKHSVGCSISVQKCPLGCRDLNCLQTVIVVHH